jgi:hypothetical protein
MAYNTRRWRRYPTYVKLLLGCLLAVASALTAVHHQGGTASASSVARSARR